MTLFILSLIFAIPLAILANLVTPWFQRTLDSFSVNRSTKRAAVEVEEYREIAKMAADKTRYYTFLLTSILRIALWIAAMGLFDTLAQAIVGGIKLLDIPPLPVNGQMPPGYVPNMAIQLYIPVAFFMVANAISLVTAIAVINISRRALRTTDRLKHIDSYEREMLERHAELRSNSDAE